MNLNTERIRALNDALRRNLPNGHAVLTAGVAALGPEAVARIVKTDRGLRRFLPGQRPIRRARFWGPRNRRRGDLFKIDYFDKTLTHHSPDPSDPSVTERVITMMLAEEY
jgi:Protein of unknown function (DUF3768)